MRVAAAGGGGADDRTTTPCPSSAVVAVVSPLGKDYTDRHFTQLARSAQHTRQPQSGSPARSFTRYKRSSLFVVCSLISGLLLLSPQAFATTQSKEEHVTAVRVLYTLLL